MQTISPQVLWFFLFFRLCFWQCIAQILYVKIFLFLSCLFQAQTSSSTVYSIHGNDETRIKFAYFAARFHETRPLISYRRLPVSRLDFTKRAMWFPRLHVFQLLTKRGAKLTYFAARFHETRLISALRFTPFWLLEPSRLMSTSVHVFALCFFFVQISAVGVAFINFPSKRNEGFLWIVC